MTRGSWLSRLAAIAGFLLCGCMSTPDPVNQLAERTGAAAGILGAELAKLGRESAEVTELRAQTIARLHAVNAELRAHYNFDLALTRKSGQGADLETIEMLRKWHSEVEELYKGVDQAGAARKAAILSQTIALDTKADAIKGLAGRLARLAEVDKPEDHLRFIAGFVKQVRNDVKQQLDKEDESSKQAKQLLHKLKE